MKTSTRSVNNKNICNGGDATQPSQRKLLGPEVPGWRPASEVNFLIITYSALPIPGYKAALVGTILNILFKVMFSIENLINKDKGVCRL